MDGAFEIQNLVNLQQIRKRPFGLREEEIAKLKVVLALRHSDLQVGDNQCSSMLMQKINAPVSLVWSVVRRFDQSERYQPFIELLDQEKGRNQDWVCQGGESRDGTTSQEQRGTPRDFG
jgi:hypothetical protein